MYPAHPDVQAPIFCFSVTTHQTGMFFIPQDVKNAMNWAHDCDLGFIVFDEFGKMRYYGVHRTTSGGEVNPERRLTAYEKIHVILFRP